MLDAIGRRLRGRSAGEVTTLVAANLVHGLRAVSPAGFAERRRQGAFDRRWGTDTTTLANLSALRVDRERARHGVRYQPSSGEALDWAVEAAWIEPARFALVDYGSGKGRIAMLAAAKDFARVVGVEFSPELCAVAEANVARFAAAGGAVRPAEIVLGDAGAFAPPEGPLFAYFYNPFGPVVLAEVIARLEAKAAGGDEVLVAYVDPRHAELFEASGRWATVARNEAALLLRAAANPS
jgi:hypothetical protein